MYRYTNFSGCKIQMIFTETTAVLKIVQSALILESLNIAIEAAILKLTNLTYQMRDLHLIIYWPVRK